MEGTIGEIKLFAGKYAPADWMLCDGKALSIRANEALYSVLGNAFGGDGNTFNLPDLRGRVPVGTLNVVAVGQQGGQEKVALQQKNLPANVTGSITGIQGNVSGTATGNGTVTIAIPCGTAMDSTTAAGKYIGLLDGSAGGYSNTDSGNMAGFNAPVTVSTNINLPLSGNAGGTIDLGGKSEPVSVMQPSLSLNYIICVYGNYPPRANMEFDSIGKEAIALVKATTEEYPDAKLMEVNARQVEGDIQLQLLFSHKKTKAILVSSTGEPPYILPVRPYGIEIETEAALQAGTIDFAYAYSLARIAGLAKDVGYIKYYHPLMADTEHPVYMFGPENGGKNIQVSVESGLATETEEMLGAQWINLTICAYGLEIAGELKVTQGTDPQKGSTKNYTYENGTCTSQGDWKNDGWNFYGATGELTLKEGDIKICVVHYDSPYSGSNKFWLTDQTTDSYKIIITSRGNTGSSGALGACSITIEKKITP